MSFLVRVIALALCLSLQTLRAQPDDASAVNLLSQSLHRAHSLKDPSGVLALFSEQSPQRAEQRKAMEKLWASGTVSETTAGDPEISGDRARVRVDRQIAGSPKRKLVLECVKEQGQWRIWREIPAAEDLAALLAAANTAADQAALLAKNPDLVDADLAAALIDRGRGARNRGEFPQALAIYGIANAVAERANATQARALALNNTGLVHYDQGDFSAALESYRQSLALGQPFHYEADTARTLNNMGAVYMDSGDLAAARESFEKSRAIGEKLHDNGLISNALGNMAVIYGQRGDYVQAFSLFDQVYKLHLPAGDQRALAIDSINLGTVFMWQGDTAQSNGYFQRAFDLADAAGLKPLMAISLMYLGQVAQVRGAYSDAVAKYQKSLAIFEQIGDKPYAASDLSFIGSAYSEQAEHAKALEYYQKAADLQRAMGGGSELALTLTRMAASYNHQGAFGDAERIAAEAATAAESLGMREGAWRAYLEAGNAHRGLGMTAQAEADFNKAITTIEDLRQDVAGSESEREGFFEDKVNAYYRMIDLLVAGHRPEEAFAYAERAKARVLLDVFKNGRTEVASLMDAADRRKEQEFRLKLASLNAQLLRAPKRSPASQVAALTAELNRTRLDYDAFETFQYAQHPEWKLRSGAIEPVALDAALQMMPAADTAFIEFVVTDDKLYAFVGGGGSRPDGAHSVKVFSTSIRREQLVARVARFREQLASRDLGFRSSAAALYRLLLGPAGTSLARKRYLIVVPDGVLWELPFQALVDPAGRYLLDNVSVSYAPSLTALKSMMQMKKERRAATSKMQLLAMANPSSSSGAVDRVKAVYRDQDLGNLPLAETEVEQLAKIYGQDRSRVYIGRDARESRFKSEAADSKVVHLATHGILNNASPLYSYLLLAGEGDGSSEDGFLEARELLQMKLHAELAVLSACETARGRVGAGEGMIGLSWALFVSGVPTTVLSQWKVESDSTSRLMVAFHLNRNKNLSDAEALRMAALSLRKDPAYQHPFYWAPFIAIGAGLN